MKLFKDKESKVEIESLKRRVMDLEDKINKSLFVDGPKFPYEQLSDPFQNIFANYKTEFSAQEIKDRFEELYGLLQV